LRIGTEYPYYGSYSALLDDTTCDSTKSIVALILTINLAGQTDVELDFWWREFLDENDPGDGVSISDDYGVHWYEVLSLNDGPEVYRKDIVDLVDAAAYFGLSLNEHFQIKFQFQDDCPITTDGYSIDEVRVKVPDSPTKTPSPTQTASKTPTSTLTVTSTPTRTPTPSPSASPTGTITPDLVADFPFYDGFESGSLGTGWSISTSDHGNVRLGTGYPHNGSYSVELDADPYYGFQTASLILTIDLEGILNAELDFWWREFDDENHPEDGVFISSDNGTNWYQILSFNNGPSSFREDIIDLDAAAAGNGISFTDHFKIMFRFYDDSYIPLYDGYAIDDIAVRPWESSIYVPLVMDQFSSNPGDVRVNDPIGSDYQLRADYAITPDGRLFAVWEDYRNGAYPDAGDIYAAFSDDGGFTWSDDIRVNDDTPGGARRRYPKITAGPSGEVYIVWQDLRNDPNPTDPNCTPPNDQNPDIYLAKFNAQTETFGSNVLVYNQIDQQASPDVVVDADGNVFVAFADLTGYPSITMDRAVVAKSTDGGTTFSTPVVADNHSNWALDPRLTIDRTNDVLYLVFQGHPDYYKPYFTRSTDGGLTWSTDVRLDAGPNREWYDAARDIAVVADDFGHVVVIWSDERNDPDNCYTGCGTEHNEFDIYTNYSLDGGITWLTTSNVLVNDDSTYAWIRYPQGAFASDGTLIAVWKDSRAGDSKGDIWMAISNDYGATWSANQRVDHALYDTNSDWPTVVFSSTSQAYILWHDSRDGDLDIYTTSITISP
jgi:hypothetical protein